MRKTTSSLLGVAILLVALAVPAAAEEVIPPDTVAALNALEAKAEDPGTTWQERWRAYKDAKDAIKEMEDGEAKKAAEAAYLLMRPMVAASLRRDELPLGGWIMGVIAALILWGGFAFHVWIAVKQGQKNK